MYIVNGKEATRAYVNSLDVNRIKEIRKGISAEEKEVLAKQYGKRVYNSYIMEIKLYSDAEMKSRNKVSKEQKAEANKKMKEENEKRMRASTLVKTGDVAPDFTVEMLNGKKYTLSDLKGKVVLVNFWATWCPPCMREFAEIPEKIIKPFSGNKNFVFIPVSRGESMDVVRKKMEMLKGNGIHFNVGIDPEKKIYTKYAKEFIPRNFLIGPDGKIAYFSIGYTPKDMSNLIQKIHELLDQ
jgi:peroxiredoxin